MQKKTCLLLTRSLRNITAIELLDYLNWQGMLLYSFQERQLSSKHLRTHGASLSVLSKII